MVHCIVQELSDRTAVATYFDVSVVSLKTTLSSVRTFICTGVVIAALVNSSEVVEKSDNL